MLLVNTILLITIWILKINLVYPLLRDIEYEALRVFFNSTHGEYWTWKYPLTTYGQIWNFTQKPRTNRLDPCWSRWQGLYCTSHDGGQTDQIFSFTLINYNLQGTIPPEIGNISQLWFFQLSENPGLSGSIPTAINYLSDLQLLNISFNSMTYTIPENFGNFTIMSYLSFESNLLTGSIPSSFGGITSLQSLYLSSNSLTGTMPSSMKNLSQLGYLLMSDNFLTGPITSFDNGACASLQYLGLRNNRFSGPLPHLELPKLYHFSLAANNFEGTLPPCYGSLLNMSTLRLDSNLLSGTVPSQLSRLTNLEVLLLRENCLHGDIGEVFSSDQHRLRNVDISANSLSGSFPASVFELPNLQTFAAIQNCFEGSIPSTVCQASSMRVLALDGLTSGAGCKTAVVSSWSHIIRGYFASSLTGSLPLCIWTLPNITTLSISGNALDGSLPDLQPSYTLRNVSIAHNRVVGRIPIAIQSFPFYFLDLSQNRLQGNILGMSNMPAVWGNSRNDTSSSSTIKLNVNRLTGKVPLSFHEATDVDILDGNVFSCNAQAPLPLYDPVADEYVCGSDGFSTSLAVFAAIFALAVVFFFLAWCTQSKSKNLKDFVRAWELLAGSSSSFSFQAESRDYSLVSMRVSLISFPEVDLPNVNKVIQFHVFFRRMCSAVTALAVFVGLPVYMAFYLSGNDNYYTHDTQYAWITSAAFLSGTVPAIILFVLYFGICLLVLYEVNSAYIRALLPDEGGVDSHRGSSVGAAADDWNWVAHSNNKSDTTVSASEASGTAPQNMIEFNRSRAAQSKGIQEFEDANDGKVRLPVDNFKDDSERVQTVPHSPQQQRGGEQARAVAAYDSDQSVDSCRHFSYFRFTKSSGSCDGKGLGLGLGLGSKSWNVTHFLAKCDCRLVCLYIGVLLVDIVVVSLINVTYLELLGAKITAAEKILIQALMAVFKVIFNSVVVRMLIARLPPSPARVQLHVALLVYNIMGAPCLASALTSSSCFQEVFTGSEIICTSYCFNYCQEVTQEYVAGEYQTTCAVERDAYFVNEFRPPFIYNYQCSSAILMAYIPVFVFSYSFLAVLTPLFFLVLASLKKKLLPRILLAGVEGILRPQDDDLSMREQAPPSGDIANHVVNGEGESKKRASTTTAAAAKHLIHANSLMAQSVQHLVVLLTFGLACPPLACVVLLALVSNTFTWETLITRFVLHYDNALLVDLLNPSKEQSTESQSWSEHDEVESAHKRGGGGGGGGGGGEDESYTGLSDNRQLLSHSTQRLTEKVRKLEASLAGSWRSLYDSIWLVISCAFAFYSFILFDMVGDRGGWQLALSVPASAIVLRIVVGVVASIIWKE